MHHGIGHMVGHHTPPDIRIGDPRPPLLVTSGGDHWRAVQTCTFGDSFKSVCGSYFENPGSTTEKFCFYFVF